MGGNTHNCEGLTLINLSFDFPHQNFSVCVRCKSYLNLTFINCIVTDIDIDKMANNNYDNGTLSLPLVVE